MASALRRDGSPPAARPSSYRICVSRIRDAAVPELYRRHRALDSTSVLTAIQTRGGRAVALEADLADAGAPARLFNAAEEAFGAVDILINNATGWVADTFSAVPATQFGHAQLRVSADTIDQQFVVDARASALLIAEFARRHVARGATWGRIVGLTGPTGFPNQALGNGAAKAALENYTMSAAFRLAARHHGKCRPPTGHRYGLGDRRSTPARGRAPGPDPHRQPGRCRRSHRIPCLRWSASDHG